MTLYLHPKRGINPRMMFCQICGGDYNGIAMIGNRNWKSSCGSCNTVGYGMSANDKCPSCGHVGFDNKVELDEFERIPSNEPCDKCKESMETSLREIDEVIKAGGIAWKCGKGHFGALRAESELAKDVRKEMNIAPPEPCGIILDDMCPVCHPEVISGGDDNGGA